MSAIWWVEEVEKVVTPLATVLVACYVSQISKRQLRQAEEKLRLDLYNRRFDCTSHL
jgi:hypothetical protein